MLLSPAVSEYILLLNSAFYYFLFLSTIPYFIRFPPFFCCPFFIQFPVLAYFFLFHFLSLFYLLSCWRSRYCDRAKRWTTKEVWFVSRYCQVICVFSKLPEQFWGPRSLLFYGYGTLTFPGIKRPWRESALSLQLVLRLGTYGTMNLCTSSLQLTNIKKVYN
jgi:hypothetical protein